MINNLNKDSIGKKVDCIFVANGIEETYTEKLKFFDTKYVVVGSICLPFSGENIGVRMIKESGLRKVPLYSNDGIVGQPKSVFYSAKEKTLTPSTKKDVK